MRAHPIQLTVAVITLAALAATGFLPATASADSHPQEVLDLIAAHQALAMKVRPLQKRIVAASTAEAASFRPEGVPLRARVATATGDGNAPAEGRVSERLRHKDRPAASADDYGRIEARVSALARASNAELERISAPSFATRATGSDQESGGVRFGDGRRGSRPSSSAQSGDATTRAGRTVDAEAIAAARRTLAALEREYAAVEREVSAAEHR